MFAHLITSALAARGALNTVRLAMRGIHTINDAVRGSQVFFVHGAAVLVSNHQDWFAARAGREAIERLTAVPNMRKLLAHSSKEWAGGADILSAFNPGGTFAEHASKPAIAAELAAIKERIIKDPAAAQALLAFGHLSQAAHAARANAQTSQAAPAQGA